MSTYNDINMSWEMSSLPLIICDHRQTGKTTRLAAAAKEAGATILCHNTVTARRVAEEQHVQTASVLDGRAGRAGLYYVDEPLLCLEALLGVPVSGAAVSGETPAHREQRMRLEKLRHAIKKLSLSERRAALLMLQDMLLP